MVNCSDEIKRRFAPWKESYDKSRQHIKKQNHHSAAKGSCSQSYRPVVMYGCDSWTVKKAEHWRIDAFQLWCWRKLLRVPWIAKRSNQSILKEISLEHSFIGRTDAEADAPILWPTDANSRLIGKDPDARNDWRQKEKGTAENEIVGRRHWLNGHEFGQTPGDSEGRGSLVCCSHGVGKNWTWLSDWTTQMETVNRSVGGRRDK